MILFSVLLGGESSQGIYRVSAEGGTATKLTLADGAPADATRAWPVFLPDGTHFLYVRGVFRGAVDDYRVCVGELGSERADCLPADRFARGVHAAGSSPVRPQGDASHAAVRR